MESGTPAARSRARPAGRYRPAAVFRSRLEPALCSGSRPGLAHAIPPRRVVSDKSAERLGSDSSPAAEAQTWRAEIRCAGSPSGEHFDACGLELMPKSYRAVARRPAAASGRLPRAARRARWVGTAGSHERCAGAFVKRGEDLTRGERRATARRRRGHRPIGNSARERIDVPTATTGSPRAWARARPVAIPIRTPVNEPGPIPIPIRLDPLPAAGSVHRRAPPLRAGRRVPRALAGSGESRRSQASSGPRRDRDVIGGGVEPITLCCRPAIGQVRVAAARWAARGDRSNREKRHVR